MAEKIYAVKLDGKEMSFSVGKLAAQADAAVLARLGGTEVLATVVRAGKRREGIDYFPLMVDYEERFYAAGKIKGSRFIKVEGRPSDAAILSARLVDRSIRPLFPEWLKNDVQVVLTVLSFDKENDPDVVGLNAAAAALMISSIPWDGPIAGLRISSNGEQFVINPSYAESKQAQANAVVAGNEDKTIMLEADGREASEEKILAMIDFAHQQFLPLLDLYKKMHSELGLEKIRQAQEPEEESLPAGLDLGKEVADFIKKNIAPVLFDKKLDSKSSRRQALAATLAKLDEHLKELQIGKDKRAEAAAAAEKMIELEVTRAIIEEDKRVDGRGLSQIRPLSIETGLLARTHGSALFSRGETQVLSVVTLDAPGLEQTLDTMEEDDTKKRYFHHYNFPPFSVGETAPLRGPGRREIGHGALAEKALQPLLPAREEFPYAVRVVSEVLSSNGSSSMASVCGSSLALMDAGVPLKKTAAGVAMGLASFPDGRWKIITDLQDLEDGPGGMDFKVAGTRDGITAIQMDTKTKGLTREMVEQTLALARAGRLEIIAAMEKVIAEPQSLSPYAPRITSIRINPEKIGTVIGPGGKMINKIIEETGVEIDIDDDGLVMITASDPAASEKAIAWVKNLTHEVAVGEKYEGRVTRIMDFGAFVEILPGQEGMIHISNLANGRVDKVQDVVKIGDSAPVEVIEIDSQGRINLKMQGVISSGANHRDRGPRRPGGRPGGPGAGRRRF